MHLVIIKTENVLLSDVNLAFQKFNSKVIHAPDRTAPLTCCSVKKTKKTWITQEL